MTSPRRVLLLDANGWGGWKMVASETLTRGLLGVRSLADVPAPLRQVGLVQRAVRDRYAALSYAVDWREALHAHPDATVDTCNILDLVEYRRYRRRIGDYDLVVVLHSATGDSMSLLNRTVHWLDRRRSPLVVFVGNEYNLLDAKLAFVRESGAEYVASQLPIESARWLYAECPGARVLAMPHALNAAVYHRFPDAARDIDIGFVGARYPLYIGDTERADALERVTGRSRELGLRVDVRHINLPREQWVRFLNRCCGVVGAEAGTRYLDRTGRLIPEVEGWLRDHPEAGAAEVFDRFFRQREPGPSGKAISSRHFEPIGTETCQVLVEGEYNGILVADEHYIALRKDFSNVDDALERLRDERYRTDMTRRALDYVLSAHTYTHRIRDLFAAVGR